MVLLSLFRRGFDSRSLIEQHFLPEAKQALVAAFRLTEPVLQNLGIQDETPRGVKYEVYRCVARFTGHAHVSGYVKIPFEGDVIVVIETPWDSHVDDYEVERKKEEKGVRLTKAA